MGLFFSGLMAALLLFFCTFAAAGEIFTRADVIGSSEPVSVSDMTSGWDGAFKPGKHAYANASFQFGLVLDGWHIAREQRWYYNFTFSKNTSRFYNALEKGQTLPVGQVDLTAKSFIARGFNAGKQLNFNDGFIRASLAYYRIDHFQFGTLKGVSEGTDTVTASAILDYHFDEDKILDFASEPDAGRGYSLSVQGEYQLSSNWRAALALHDVYNRFEFSRAGFTTGCINFGQPDNRQCDSPTVASGRSGHEAFTSDIPVTVSSALKYQPHLLTAHLYWHDEYLRVGLEKSWNTSIGQFSVLGYSTRQLGLGWRSRWHTLELSSDEGKAAKVRDVDIKLGLHYRW